MTNSAMIPDPWSEPSMHRYPGRIYGQGDAGAEARQRLTKNTTSKKMPLKAASINLGKIHQQTAGFAAGMMLAVNQLGDTNKTIEGRNKSVKRGIVLDKQRWTRKRTRDLRAKQEAGLEEKGKLGLGDRYTKKIVNKAGGMFSKAMDFVGWLALGWIVNSFLKVVKIGEEWYKKVKDVWDNITKSVKDFVGWITGNNKKEEELPTFDPEKDVKDMKADVNKTLNDIDKDINDENKNAENVEGGEEAPNQWWDFLDLFPNKKKDDGQISDDELKEVNEERAIGGQPPLTKKEIEIGEDPEEKNLWEQLSEKVNAIFNRSKSSEKGKNNAQFQKFTKDAKPVNMEGVEIPQTKKISLDLKNEGAPSSEDGSVVEGSDQPNKEKKPIVVDQKDIVSSKFKVSTVKVDEIISNKKKKKVIVPVNMSNGNGNGGNGNGGTKTKIIRVNGGETLNSTIDKVSQLESAYL